MRKRFRFIAAVFAFLCAVWLISLAFSLMTAPNAISVMAGLMLIGAIIVVFPWILRIITRFPNKDTSHA